MVMLSAPVLMWLKLVGARRFGAEWMQIKRVPMPDNLRISLVSVIRLVIEREKQMKLLCARSKKGSMSAFRFSLG